METPSEYKLTDQERRAVALLNQQLANAKVLVFNLNAQLEKALKDVATAEAQWEGALHLLAIANGMDKARISPDFTELKRTQ